jgi:thioredoxin reductase
LWNTVATECQGDGDLLNNLRIKNVKTGEEKDLPVHGLFYAIGMAISTYVATVFSLSEISQDMNLRLLSSEHN